MFLCFITFGGRVGKASESQKKGGGIRIEKEFLCLLLLLSQPFQVRCLEQKENQGRLCSHRPRTAMRPGWSHFHQCWLSRSRKDESLQLPVLNPVSFHPFLQKPPAPPTTPASCSLTEPLRHLPSEGHGPLGGITPVAQSLTGPHCPREFFINKKQQLLGVK